MIKLALALLLALFFSCAGVSASIGAHALPPARGLLVDGVYRRRAPTITTKRRSLRRRKSSASGAPAIAATVTEIDAAGLKKLLPRSEGGAAQPLLINFWATWCAPCRQEFPDLVKIDNEYRGRGLEFITISADEVAELKTGVPKFLREMRAIMPAYLLNAIDTEAAIAQVDPAWGGELPATFLFDRRGKLIYKHTGLIDAAELRAAIEKAMTSDQ